MARPAGRYFASVISKIRDAKKKEQIVIDEGFKMQLRQEMMMKIAAGHKSVPVKKSFMEWFMPMKSYLAVVPAFAFMIVAVIGISKLPINFGSNVVVPTANPSPTLESKRPQPFSTTLNSLRDSQPADTAVEQETSGIQTFPGRYVLPPNYGSDSSASSDAVQSAQAPAPSELEGQSAISAQKVQENPVSNQQSVSENVQNDTSLAQPLAFQATSVDMTEPNAQVVSPQPAALQSVEISPMTPVSQNTTSTSAQSGASNDAAMQSTGVTPSVTVPPSTVSSTPSVTVDSAAAPQIDTSAKTEASLKLTTNAIQANPLKISSDAVTSLRANDLTIPTKLTLNEIALLPAQHLNVGVYYNGNFSSDERTILEKNLLPHMAEGKSLSYISVYQSEGSPYVGIELNFTDGNTVRYDYKIDERGTWTLSPSVSQDSTQP